MLAVNRDSPADRDDFAKLMVRTMFAISRGVEVAIGPDGANTTRITPFGRMDPYLLVVAKVDIARLIKVYISNVLLIGAEK